MPQKVRPFKTLITRAEYFSFPGRQHHVIGDIPVVVVPAKVFDEMRKEIQSIMFDRTNMRTAKQVLIDSEVSQ